MLLCGSRIICAVFIVNLFAVASSSVAKDFGFFFPYGKGYDYVLVDPPHFIFADGDEDNGVFIHFLSDFLPLFNNQDVKDLFFSVNGYVSFEQVLFSNEAEPFPAPSTVMNIYHGNLKFTEAENSFFSFREYTHDDSAMMYRAKFEIETFGKQVNFNPKLVVVVTWSNAQKVDSDGQATFQLVLTTDGKNTYAIYNYKDLSFDQSTYDFCPITIGWQENESPLNFYQHPNMQLSASTDGENRPIRMQYESNVGVPGKWIYHVYKNKIEDPTTSPSPNTTAAPLPAACPDKTFCHNKPQLASWPGYPKHFVVCSGASEPVCMTCPESTMFSSLCGVCIHPFQLGKECPTPPVVIENKFEESEICNHHDATKFCALKKHPFGRYHNYNDITGVTFYQCAGVYGSWCRPCAPGTVFRQYEHNRNEGLCVHKDETNTGYWY